MFKHNIADPVYEKGYKEFGYISERDINKDIINYPCNIYKVIWTTSDRESHWLHEYHIDSFKEQLNEYLRTQDR